MTQCSPIVRTGRELVRLLILPFYTDITADESSVNLLATMHCMYSLFSLREILESFSKFFF
jgi:hypothetical protein